MVVSTTFVTYFKDISGVEEANEFLKLNNECVFYGNNLTCLKIWKVRREYGLLDKTLCLPVNLSDLPDSKHLELLRQNISENGVYGRKDFIEAEDLVWNWSSLFYLKQVSDFNPFNTSHVCLLSQKLLKNITQEALDKINNSWVQDGIMMSGLRLIQTDKPDEDLYLDARKFYDINWCLIIDEIMGGRIEDINQVYEKVDRQKVYLLKIKKVVQLQDILARIVFFFKEFFDVVNTLEITNNHQNMNYIDIFCHKRFDIEKILKTGQEYRNKENHQAATEILSKLADAVIDNLVRLDKSQTYSLFYELAISSFYVRYELYKRYTNWFKEYLNKNNYTVEDNFWMNLNF